MARYKNLPFYGTLTFDNRTKKRHQYARGIDIIDFLDKEGFTPERIDEYEAWYYCPIFGEDQKICLRVDRQYNTWFDHNSREYGNIIDLFSIIYGYNNRREEAINKLCENEKRYKYFDGTIDNPQNCRI